MLLISSQNATCQSHFKGVAHFMMVSVFAKRGLSDNGIHFMDRCVSHRCKPACRV